MGPQQSHMLWVDILFSCPFGSRLANHSKTLDREHYDNIVFTSTFSEHFRDPSVLYHTDPAYIFLQ